MIGIKQSENSNTSQSQQELIQGLILEELVKEVKLKRGEQIDFMVKCNDNSSSINNSIYSCVVSHGQIMRIKDKKMEVFSVGDQFKYENEKSNQKMVCMSNKSIIYFWQEQDISEMITQLKQIISLTLISNEPNNSNSNSSSQVRSQQIALNFLIKLKYYSTHPDTISSDNDNNKNKNQSIHIQSSNSIINSLSSENQSSQINFQSQSESRQESASSSSQKANRDLETQQRKRLCNHNPLSVCSCKRQENSERFIPLGSLSTIQKDQSFIQEEQIENKSLERVHDKRRMIALKDKRHSLIDDYSINKGSHHKGSRWQQIKEFRLELIQDTKLPPFEQRNDEYSQDTIQNKFNLCRQNRLRKNSKNLQIGSTISYHNKASDENKNPLTVLKNIVHQRRIISRLKHNSLSRNETESKVEDTFILSAIDSNCTQNEGNKNTQLPKDKMSIQSSNSNTYNIGDSKQLQKRDSQWDPAKKNSSTIHYENDLSHQFKTIQNEPQDIQLFNIKKAYKLSSRRERAVSNFVNTLKTDFTHADCYKLPELQSQKRTQSELKSESSQRKSDKRNEKSFREEQNGVDYLFLTKTDILLRAEQETSKKRKEEKLKEEYKRTHILGELNEQIKQRVARTFSNNKCLLISQTIC